MPADLRNSDVTGEMLQAASVPVPMMHDLHQAIAGDDVDAASRLLVSNGCRHSNT